MFNFTRFMLMLIAVFLISEKPAFTQISEGGKPRQPEMLKSNVIPVVEMPAILNSQLISKVKSDIQSKIRLKPLQFAHSFEVNLSPKNSGIWTTTKDGYAIWQLKIRSKTAKSINLIFDHFSLPNGARLFLYNENKSQILGAFTSRNNKSSGKFAVLPVAGEEITLQYELPEYIGNKNNFTIKKVNHDFTGILKYDERRPLNKTAGSCNIDIKCPEGDEWADVKDAVCRIIVNGVEICSGTLINNTEENEKPYVISAAHCYDEWKFAETSVYTFNYESPYCAPLDGDPTHSISGAIMKAQFDSLDFALTELSVIPPPEYHPYYAGWDRQGNIPDSSVSIHHPQGDIKKIAWDSNSAEFSSFNSSYTPNGFTKILRWDGGVTENGSSGGALLNSEQNLIGTLTGGAATCSNPVRDYFSRFDMAWDFKNDSTKQLKYWLDPLSSGLNKLDGKRFDENENLCQTFTNLDEFDNHENIKLTTSGEFNGFWGGTNNAGITEISERFSITGEEELAGISIGVGKLEYNFANSSEITLKIYNGQDLPETLIYSEDIPISDFEEDAMTYIGLTESISPADTFFVAIELSNMLQQDTFAIYQSLREPEKENNFYFKQDDIWKSFKTSNLENYSISNVIEILACNVLKSVKDTFLVDDELEIIVYPNPTNSSFTVEAGKQIELNKLQVFNLLGKEIMVGFSDYQERKVKIDLSGNVPGVYFVRFNNGKGFVTRKISYVPW
jgi:hypothetical protein